MSQENATGKRPLLRYVNRQQMGWRAADVEQLISEDHPARAYQDLVVRSADGSHVTEIQPAIYFRGSALIHSFVVSESTAL
jgi:hypothetical protein